MTGTIPTSVTDPVPDGAQHLRSSMRLDPGIIYLDHAAVSPVPQSAAQAMAEYVEQVRSVGDLAWGDWSKGVEIGRSRAARFLGCETHEIALIPHTTYGINVVAMGAPWSVGDNVVIPQNEFPSNSLPWRLLSRRGVDVRIVSVDDSQLSIDRLMESVDSKTKVVSVSWVDFAAGHRIDLAELCRRVHDRGAKVFIDAIQGLGAFPLSMREVPIDFLAADGHKWLLGPEGAGVLFIRQSLLDWLEPVMMGWGSVDRAYMFDANHTTLKPSASRYEGGSSNMAGLLGLSASLGTLLEAGCHRSDSNIASTILERTAELHEGLLQLGALVARSSNPDHRSGIVAFAWEGIDCHVVRKRLLEAGIVMSVRQNRLRAAVHAYNTPAEIAAVIDELKGCVRR